MELPDLNEMDDVILEIEDENGTKIECQVIAMFEYEDEAYAALTPTDEDNNDAYLFRLQIEDQGDELEFTLDNIDDEEKLEEVGQVFTQILEQAGEDDDEDSYASDDEPDDEWDEFIHKKIEEIP